MSKTRGGGLYVDLGKNVKVGEGPTFGGRKTLFQRLFGSSKSKKRRCRPKKQKTRRRRT